MKKFINKLLFVLLILSGQWTMVSGQTSNAIPYQGVARNAAGNIVADQPISLRFSILQGSALGTLVYQETHNVSTNSLGLFDVKITGGTTTGVFNPLAWSTLAASGAFLKVEMDISGGSAYVDMGTTQLLSVPFALYAERSGSSFGSVVYAGTWDALTNDPPLAGSTGNKGDYYVVTVAGNHTLNAVSEWNVGDWAIYNGSVWQKVDNSEAPVNSADVSFTPNTDITATNVQDAIVEVRDDADTKLSSKLNLSGGTLTGSLILNADPSASLGAATKQYVDDVQSSVTAKVNRSGDTMTGDLILNASPSTALGAATKQYVDAADALKTDKVTGAVNGNFATLDASGNLTDGGAKTASNIPFIPDAVITSTNVQDAIRATSAQFSTMIDSYIHKIDDGVSIYLPPAGTRKRFGIGDTAPESPLGISSEGTDQRVLTIKPGTLATGPTYSFSLRSAGTPGFNLEEASSGAGNTSRLFIQESTGHMTLNRGTDDRYLLGLREYSPASSAKLGLTNTAVTTNNAGWSIGHFQNGDIPEQDGVFSISEEPLVQPGTSLERLTILSGGRVGINEPLPYANLHVTRSSSDPEMPINTALGSGIMMVGATIGKNIVLDNHQIQAREYNPLKQYVAGDTKLGIQPLGGGVIFHENSSASTDKAIITYDAMLGLGTVTPTEKLHIENSTTNGITGIRILNTATTVNQGWLFGHINDQSITEHNGAFGFFENTVAEKIERITVLPGGNTGINELIPDTKLHVSRPLADPNTAISLIEGTGIMTIGPITNNIVADYRGIQARTGTYIGTTLELTASELNIQRLGGDILIHGNSSVSSEKVVIKNDGRIGIGVLTPSEKIDIDGAIKIGTSITAADGTIRFTGTDFEGRKNGAWKSLTTQAVTDGFGEVGAGKITYNATNPKVGIGVNVPANALQVYNNEALVSSGSSAVLIQSEATTSSTSMLDTRVGIEIKNNTQWSTNGDAKNIGIFVSTVSGQTSKEANLAAVLNGNVVIGDLTSSKIVGSNGTNVLAIQTGSIPTTSAGTGYTAGIQIYSDDLPLAGSGLAPVSILHVMNGDGTVIKLFRATALTTADNSGISSTTYGSTEEAVINNLRTRLNELEAKLRAYGLLE